MASNLVLAFSPLNSKTHPVNTRLSVLIGALLFLLPVGPGLFAAENSLHRSMSADWTPGQVPPKPWSSSNDGADITVKAATYKESTWIELIDNSTEKSASLRQQFPALSAGRLSFRIAVAKDHIGEFGIYLGQGNASAPAERIIEIKVNSRGLAQLGSIGKRENSTLRLTAGMVDHLFLDFKSANNNLELRLGQLEKDGTETLITETTVPQQGYPVSRLRIATDLLPRGGHFYVSDLVLTPAP